MSFPGATEEVQWGNDLLFKVGGKTFVFSGFNPPFAMSIKCSGEEDFNALIERPGCVPAPYLARNKWVMLESADAIPWNELQMYIRKSYDTIFAKLPKRAQREIANP